MLTSFYPLRCTAACVIRIGFKPPATIGQGQATAKYDGTAGVLEAKGRHDPCVVPRSVFPLPLLFFDSSVCDAIADASASLASHPWTSPSTLPSSFTRHPNPALSPSSNPWQPWSSWTPSSSKPPELPPPTSSRLSRPSPLPWSCRAWASITASEARVLLETSRRAMAQWEGRRGERRPPPKKTDRQLGPLDG
jgi:hypothetical protein